MGTTHCISFPQLISVMRYSYFCHMHTAAVTSFWESLFLLSGYACPRLYTELTAPPAEVAWTAFRYRSDTAVPGTTQTTNQSGEGGRGRDEPGQMEGHVQMGKPNRDTKHHYFNQAVTPKRGCLISFSQA